ncbi:MAG: CsbD family protein [Burkholderiaceae bacterium]|nr:CsbD family protein [Burkholderiaceae bacterium]
MNDDQVKGKVDQLKGGVKQGVGGAIGDKRMEREGTADRVGGKIQEGIGNLKDKLTGRDPDAPRE